jgi:uncharacterized small protein (DUF1192 family)
MTQHANAGSGEKMSNEEMNALIIEAAVEQYAPIITEGKTKTIQPAPDQNEPPIIVPITPEERIAEAATFVTNLTIAGIDDKENYKLAKSVLAGVKKWRTGIEAKRKELKAVALEYGRKVDGEAKRLTELVSKVEVDLTTKVDAIDKAIEEARKAEQLRRHKLLTETAWQFTGQWYVCGVHSIDASTMPTASEEQLTEWLAIGQAELDRLEAERVRKEEEAKAAAEAARKAAEDAKRLEAENAQKDAELAEMRRKLAEMEAANKPQPEPTVTVAYTEGPKYEVKETPRMFEGHPRPQGFEVPKPQPTEPTYVVTEVAQTVHTPADPFANIPAPKFTPPGVGSVTINDYTLGFEDCRAQVLAIFNDGIKRTRPEFIELFTNIKPSK